MLWDLDYITIYVFTNRKFFFVLKKCTFPSLRYKLVCSYQKDSSHSAHHKYIMNKHPCYKPHLIIYTLGKKLGNTLISFKLFSLWQNILKDFENASPRLNSLVHEPRDNWYCIS